VWFQGDLSSSVGRGVYCGEEFQAIKPRVASQRLKPTRNTRVRVRLLLAPEATMGTAAKLRLAMTDSLYVCVGVLPVNSREVKLKCISR